MSKSLRVTAITAGLLLTLVLIGPFLVPIPPIGNITVPSLVISGDDDRLVPVESSVRLAGALPHAELVVIPECAHVPHEECPGPFLEAVEAFLTGLP
jgi:pimeloyl-ACP methyl ester carboxylesterase